MRIEQSGIRIDRAENLRYLLHEQTGQLVNSKILGPVGCPAGIDVLDIQNTHEIIANLNTPRDTRRRGQIDLIPLGIEHQLEIVVIKLVVRIPLQVTRRRLRHEQQAPRNQPQQH